MLKQLVAGVVTVILTSAAIAGPYEDGIDAYARGDDATALRIWQPLAEQGDAAAQSNLGDMYALGEGVPQDFAEAARWYRLAAEQGNASAQYKLGFLYYQGQGLQHDVAEAVKWMRMAAEQGNADAQFNLGISYAKGEGVPQDIILAHMWFNLSASQGSADAKENRDLAASQMTALLEKLADDTGGRPIKALSDQLLGASLVALSLGTLPSLPRYGAD